MLLKDYGLGQREGKIYDLRNTGRRKYFTDDELFLFLKHKGVPIPKIEESIKVLKEEADKASKPGEVSKVKIEIASEMNPFRNIVIITNVTERSDVVYYKNGNITEVISSLSAFDSRLLRNILRVYEPDFLDGLHYRMASAISPKDWTLISDIQVLDICFNVGILNTTVERITVRSDMHPAILEHLNKMCLVTIPFKLQEGVGLQDLHPYLRDFLERVEYHEYLCAILYSHFCGNLLPYVVYLKGNGGDAKTSFISMLGRLTRSIATFDGSDRFNYFNMYGKSILGLSENESTKLMENKVVKSVTGGNYVPIEGKGRNSFNGQVRGLILVDSNYDLELLGKEYEKRRLRYFRVQPLVKSHDFVEVLQEYFIDQMLTTSNEFLNYCRQWYEKLQIVGSHGLVQTLPNHEEIFQELIDVVQEHKFGEFYRNFICRKYIICEGSKCESLEILTEIERRFPREPFIIRNFKKYLESNYSIKISGKFFIGIKRYNKELEDDMPKE